MLLAEELPPLAENWPEELLLIGSVHADIVGVSSLLHEPHEELPMKLMDRVDHKLRHLLLISQPASFCEIQTCQECGGESYKVSTPTEISFTCECGLLEYKKINQCK